MDPLVELILNQPVPEVVPEWLAALLKAETADDLPLGGEDMPLEVPMDLAKPGRAAVGECGI